MAWHNFNWRPSRDGNATITETVEHIYAVLFYSNSGEGWGIQRDRVHPSIFYRTQPEAKLAVEKEILSDIARNNRNTQP